MMRLSGLALVALLAATAGGCGDDCGSLGGFSGETGLDVLVVCGEFPTPTATPTPTPTPG